MASVKLGEDHARRITVLVNRARVLKELYDEMYHNLLIEQETTKEIVQITEVADSPDSRASTEFMEHYQAFKVVEMLFHVTAKEIETEKEFVEWHMTTNILPEHDLTLKMLGGEMPEEAK
jgi:hypothetical protein